MPAGKIQSHLGGIGWVSKTPTALLARKMIECRKGDVKRPTPKQMEKISKELSEAFREYQIRYRGAVTYTERKRVVDLISGRARKLLNDPSNNNWKESLFDALSCTLKKPHWKRTDDGSLIPVRDQMLKIEVSKYLSRSNRDHEDEVSELPKLMSSLESLRSLEDNDLRSVLFLVDLEKVINLKPTKWADPYLVELVLNISPLWATVTGRSLKRTSKGVEGDKVNYFANWLRDSFRLLSLKPPPEKRVLDVVRYIEKLKNPDP